MLLGSSESAGTNAQAQQTLEKAYQQMGSAVEDLPPLVSKSVSSTHFANRAYHARTLAQQALNLLEHLLAGTDDPGSPRKVASLICEAYEIL